MTPEERAAKLARFLTLGNVRWSELELARLIAVEIREAVEEALWEAELKRHPQPEDIGKVDITGGMSSENYVRKVRGS